MGGCPGASEAAVSALEDEGAGEGAAGSLGLTLLSSHTLSLANLTWSLKENVSLVFVHVRTQRRVRCYLLKMVENDGKDVGQKNRLSVPAAAPLQR